MNPVREYQKKLSKTFEIIDTCFELKAALLKQKYPKASQKEITGMIYKGILSRKEKQWKLQKTL